MVYFAGQVAERIFRGKAGRVRRCSLSCDNGEALDLAFYAVSSDAAAAHYLEFLYQWAKDILEVPAYWEMVEAVAVMLIQRRRLSHRAIQVLVLSGEYPG
jgi:hypothetical protein